MGTRNRNTLTNNRSKQTPGAQSSLTPYGANPQAPLLNPTTYGGYAAQVMGLQQRLAAALALSKAGIGAANGQFMLAKDQARMTRINETVSAESDALGRGVAGGSGDLQARAAAITDAAGLRQQAVADRALAVAGYRSQNISAVGDFYSGLGTAQADLANRQAELANTRFQQDQFDVLQQNFMATRADVLRKLRSRGRARDILPGVPAPGTTQPNAGLPIAQAPNGRPLY